MIKGFPHYQQLDEMDCGSTSLRMIAKYYGKEYSAEMLRNHCHITRNGVSMLGISEAAEKAGIPLVYLNLEPDNSGKLPDKQAYVGTWESATTSLLIDAGGRVIYKHRPSPSTSKSLDAPIKAYEGNDFIVGVGPLTTRFVVSAPPHQVEGSWKMTVDGQELTRR